MGAAEDVDLSSSNDVPLSAEVYRNGQKLGTIADVDSGYITNHIREGWNGTPAFSSIPRTKSVRKWVGDVNHTDGTIEYFIEVNRRLWQRPGRRDGTAEGSV